MKKRLRRTENGERVDISGIDGDPYYKSVPRILVVISC